MGANGLDAAVFEEDDLIQPLHRGNAMGDEEGGLPCPAGLQVVQNDLLRPGIHRRDGVVQNEDGRILQQGARNGDALLLPAGNGDATFAEDGLVAVLEVHDVVPHIGQAGGPLDVLLGGVIHAECDVVSDGV